MAVVILASPNTPAHSLKLELVVMTTTGVLVELAEQVEQQRAAGRAERQVAQFIKDNEIGAHQPQGQLCRILPIAFSCSSALTSSMVEKNRTFLR